jgi:hypothetical protein
VASQEEVEKELGEVKTKLGESTTALSSANKNRKRFLGTTIVMGLVIAIYFVFGIADLNISFGDDDDLRPDFPADGPAEFLYLDSARVNAYLAQVNGGTFDEETVKNIVSASLEGRVGIDGSGGGGSQKSENSVEKTVRPTDASRFFALYSAIEAENDLERRELTDWSAFATLEEGDFVRFKTASLVPPVYTNAYLASRQKETLSSIFPGRPGGDRGKSQKRRNAAEAFRETLGDDPRIVFAVNPNPDEETPTYLLPLSAKPLNAERSLIKNGGGHWIVVGKVARVFADGTPDGKRAYVDSATQETWERPLHFAPSELLCRTNGECAHEVRKKRLTGAARRKVIRGYRQQEIISLREQVEIVQDGAVIIPIAIYK